MSLRKLQRFSTKHTSSSPQTQLSIVFDFIWDGTWGHVFGSFYLDNFYIYGDYYTPNELPICTDELTVHPITQFPPSQTTLTATNTLDPLTTTAGSTTALETTTVDPTLNPS